MQKVNIKKADFNYDYDNLTTRSKTDMIVIHHTGNPTDDDLSANEINASHQAQGWTCIGYHYVIRKNGNVEEGRPHWTVGAHTYGENSHTIGVHVCGNFEIGQPTAKQIEALAMLLANICGDYGLSIDREHIKGHRELMPTACPGCNLYSQLDEVVGKANWYANN